MDSLPSLTSLHLALLNDEEAEEELMQVVCHLVICAIEDPGVPQYNRHFTHLHQSLKQVSTKPQSRT